MKTMKKSMFITTILMVVLLVVALSTATFAWYTANTTATAKLSTVTSAKSEAASISIDSSSNISSTKTQISMSFATEVGPMIPTAELTKDTTYGTLAFTSAPIDNAGNFTAAGSNATAAKISKVENAEQNNFFVINTNKENSTAISAAVTIPSTGYIKKTFDSADFDSLKASLYTYDAATQTYTVLASEATYSADTDYYVVNNNIANALKVAIFVGTNDNDSKLVGVWGAGTVYYGTITSGEHSTTSLNKWEEGEESSKTALNVASGTSLVIASTVNAQSAINVRVVAWYDGVALGTTDAGAAAQFSIQFGVAGTGTAVTFDYTAA